MFNTPNLRNATRSEEPSPSRGLLTPRALVLHAFVLRRPAAIPGAAPL